jgi:hypothetical protein
MFLNRKFREHAILFLTCNKTKKLYRDNANVESTSFFSNYNKRLSSTSGGSVSTRRKISTVSQPGSIFENSLHPSTSVSKSIARKSSLGVPMLNLQRFSGSMKKKLFKEMKFYNSTK